MKKILFITVIAVLCAGTVLSEDAKDKALLDKVYYSMVSGTITKALELLNAAGGELPEEGRTLKQGLTRRFLTKTEEYPTEKGLLGELLSIHRSYWTKVLNGEWSVEQGKKELYGKQL